MRKKSPLFRSVLLFAGMLALSVQGISQNPSLKVFEQWRTESGSQNMFYRAGAITIPGTINSIVYGATLNANGNYDMLVEKLNGSGSVLWSYQYDGPGAGDDVAADVYYDPSNNYTYVAGSYFESSVDSFNAIVIALDPSGAIDWSATYNGNGSGADGFVDIVLDPGSGEIYCSGTEWEGFSTFYDVLLVKYDATGSQLWTTTYDYMSMIDGGYKFLFSAKPVLLAAVQDAPADVQYGILDINPSSGGVVGSNFSGGTAIGYDYVGDMTTDDTGNVYVVGSVFNVTTGLDIRVTKYDTLLNIVWEHDFDGGFNLQDFGTGVALDSHNNVIVVGSMITPTQGMNYKVLKYDNAGSLNYQNGFNGSANGNDSAAAVVVDQNHMDRIYVTGVSFNGSTNDFWTLKYDDHLNQKWGIGMNSILNGDDRPSAIALDTLGDVIVTGPTKLGGYGVRVHNG